jgi:[CysO sulfur-carrier protein]-S-L-cysteine hydrolase
MSALQIPGHISQRMIAQARAGAPLEVCGILGGKGNIVSAIYPMTNTDASRDHFMMDPREQFSVVKALRSQELEMLAVYHSHPVTPARISDEDLRLALTPGISYVIVSLADPSTPEVRSFRIADKKVGSEELRIIDD